MAIEHIITQSDTLFSLAEEYLGNPKRWREIVEYNKLDAPYIMETREEVEAIKFGHGYITIVRAQFSTPLIIPKGWTFKTKPYIIGGMVKEFKVTEQTYIPAGVPAYYVHVRSTVEGDYGNVSAGLVVLAGDEFRKNNISFTAITNQEGFIGGSNKKVLTVGDSIYLPSENEIIIPSDVATMLEYLGGEDLALEPLNGQERSFVVDGFGDIKTVKGMENIERSVRDRLLTEKGELQLHPEYGTNLAGIIGKPNLPYMRKLAELDIYETLSHEDRIRDVVITRLDINATTVELELTYKPASVSRESYMSLVLNYGSNRG